MVRAIWDRIKKYVPWRIRRRTWCFCKCSCKRLEKILQNIHASHCNWGPQCPENLDETTKHCIVLIMDSAKDALSCRDMEYRLVGSSAEGLGKPYTLELQNGYRDAMGRFLLRFFCCCCPCSTSYTSLRTDFDIILECANKGNGIGKAFNVDATSSLVPGFARLQYNRKETVENENPWQCLCEEFDGNVFLSSTLVRRAVVEVVNSTSESSLPASYIFGVFKHLPIIELEEKGPAVKLATYPLGQAWYWNEDQKLVSFEGDFVFGIHFFQPWPECALGWANRPRHWPSQDDVKVISESGFIMVAKSSNQGSDLSNGLEWHVSFPHAETYLSHRIPKVTKACFLALKLILKNHLIYHCEDLKTYYLKTMLLWELEKHPVEFWSLDNIEDCFDSLLSNFISCVNNQKCPNYWIESINLFEKISRKDLSALSNVLASIRSNAAPYIEDFGSMWC